MPDAHFLGSSQPAEADPKPVPVTVQSYDASAGHEPGLAPEKNNRKSGRAAPRRRLLVLGSLLVVGLAGASALGNTSWRMMQQKDATLDTPVQVAGLFRDDSEQARDTADYLRTGLAAAISAERSIGAVYTDPAASDRNVLLFGGTTLIWRPERALDQLFELVVDDSEAFSDPREVPAGDLGGVMKCGTIRSDETSICGWADHGSVAMAIFRDRDLDESAHLLREIRSAAQTRS